MNKTSKNLRPKEASQEPEYLRLNLKGMGPFGEPFDHHGDELVYAFGGISGEEVVARVVRRFKDRVLAQVEEVVSPSPHRVEAPCSYFGACTGCQWQHIDYSHQLELKRQTVQKEMDSYPSLAGIDVLPTLASPQELHYRNHARFTVGHEGDLGFVNSATRSFVRVDHCKLMDPWINEALQEMQDKCDETSQLSVRYGINTGDWLIQPSLLNADIALQSGQTHYEESLEGKRFRVAASSFFQVNTRQTEQMSALIQDRLKLTGEGVLVDAYAGVGTLGVLMAPKVTKVVAIEESPSAVKDAAINTLGIYNIEFCLGKTEDVLEGLEQVPDYVILDPPRKGCHPQTLETLIKRAPGKIAYVSCEPESLARDLDILVEGPFRLDEVQPIDMFPQTYHTECLAILSRKD